MSPIPDTPVSAVTPERLSELLTEEGLQHRLEAAPATADEATTVVVRTGFINAAIALSIDGDYLVADSMWRGEVTKKDAPRLLAMVNEWNQTQYMPTLRFFESSAGLGHLTVQAVANRDTPVILAVVVISATAYILINLVVDLLYPVLDPRLRRKASA